MPVFGFKAKQALSTVAARGIVPCLCLDSRQNLCITMNRSHPIVPCLCLDSRQNLDEFGVSCFRLYHACVWIQGKTLSYETPLLGVLYHACVWIQGKTKRA